MCDIKHHKLCTITQYDTYCMTKSGKCEFWLEPELTIHSLSQSNITQVTPSLLTAHSAFITHKAHIEGSNRSRKFAKIKTALYNYAHQLNYATCHVFQMQHKHTLESILLDTFVLPSVRGLCFIMQECALSSHIGLYATLLINNRSYEEIMRICCDCMCLCNSKIRQLWKVMQLNIVPESRGYFFILKKIYPYLCSNEHILNNHLRNDVILGSEQAQL